MVLAQLGTAAVVVGLDLDGSSGPPAPPVAAERRYVAGVPSGAAALGATAGLPATHGLGASAGAEPLGRSTPVHVRIPRVGIDTDLMSLGRRLDGTIEVPPPGAASPAGWYRNLASPGEAGPAVILGHVDAPATRAVFFNLGAMRAGDQVHISRADGSDVSFTVDRVAAHPRDAFPTAAVYGDTPYPALRLITCAGEFSPESGYATNVVVYASMAPDDAAEVRPARPWWRPGR